MASVFYFIGWAETLGGVVAALMVVGIPYGLAILVPIMETLDPRVELAAQTLGANKWHVFTKIIIPQLIPGITSVAINVFLRVFGNFTLVLLLAGPGTMTMCVLVFSLLTSPGGSDHENAALTLFFMIPMLLFTIISLTLSNYLRKRAGIN